MEENLAPRSGWLAIPLGIFAILCLYLYFLNPSALRNFDPTSMVFIFGTFSIAPLAVLLTTAFAVLYIYRTLRRQNLNQVAQVIGWLFVIIVSLALLYITLGAGRSCTGLFGVKDSCIDTNYLDVVLLLLNPYVMVIWEVLAATGVITLLASPTATSSKN